MLRVTSLCQFCLLQSHTFAQLFLIFASQIIMHNLSSGYMHSFPAMENGHAAGRLHPALPGLGQAGQSVMWCRAALRFGVW
jgi:hypothetical protein